MKKTLLSLFLLSALGANAQTTIFEDSFDFYPDFAIANVGAWTLTDVDLRTTYGFTGTTFLNSGVAKSFQVFNAALTDPPLTPTAASNWTARTGEKHMVCFASGGAAPIVNNDWLISPQITLGTSGNVLTFWAKSCDTAYGLERFKVGVSTTGTAVANFTVISAAPYVTTPSNATWVQYTYALPATYNGLPVNIAINCVSNDQFGFAVDDFKVTTTGLSTEDFFAQNFTMYPNPSNGIVNLSASKNASIEMVQITDLNGRVVKVVNVGGVNESQINVSDLTSGVYFVNVKTATGLGSAKLVKN